MRFKLFDRVTVVCWGQEVAGHKDKDRFAGHCCVRCENEGGDEMCLLPIRYSTAQGRRAGQSSVAYSDGG